MLDHLPPWARHLLIVAGATFAGYIAQQVIANAGVFDVDWPAALRSAVDSAAVSTSTAAAALWLTPLTRRYGVGKDK
jgi:hypothetical protein